MKILISILSLTMLLACSGEVKLQTNRKVNSITPAPIEGIAQSPNNKLLMHFGGGSAGEGLIFVRLITVNGLDYIVVTSNNGVAITPARNNLIK